MKLCKSSLINLNSDHFCEYLQLIPLSIFTETLRLLLHRLSLCNGPGIVPQLLPHISQTPFRSVCQSTLLPGADTLDSDPLSQPLGEAI